MYPSTTAAPSGTLSAVTYHHYSHCPLGASFFLLEPTCLEVVDAWGAMYWAIAAPHGVAAWAGETAETGGGGVPGLTDSFTSTLYYAWQLGTLPLQGVELSARQALVGGDYELINHHGAELQPNADFWLIALFRGLVGGARRAFPVTLSRAANSTGARVFAFDAAGGGRLIMALNLNAADETILVRLAGAGAGAARTEWHLTGEPGVSGGPAACNGAPLRLGDDGVLTDWRALGRQASGDVALAPASVVLALLAP